MGKYEKYKTTIDNRDVFDKVMDDYGPYARVVAGSVGGAVLGGKAFRRIVLGPKPINKKALRQYKSYEPMIFTLGALQGGKIGADIGLAINRTLKKDERSRNTK